MELFNVNLTEVEMPYYIFKTQTDMRGFLEGKLKKVGDGMLKEGNDEWHVIDKDGEKILTSYRYSDFSLFNKGGHINFKGGNVSIPEDCVVVSL